MNVLLISQCTKNALAETKRILDHFAERRGERTWQSPITLEGLKTLHKMLRKTARKNTAVACHWLRGKNHSELIWIVGDARRFNAQGAVPTNTTTRDILRSDSENDWHTAEEIRLLAMMAALFHDFGKSTLRFQTKLTARMAIADAYRHEWVSLRLLEALVGDNSDEQWLTNLAKYPEKAESISIAALARDGLDRRLLSPFESLPPLARVVGWLIVSHHRMPTQEKSAPLHSALLKQLPDYIEDHWCGSRCDADIKEIEACWLFKKGLPFNSPSWQKRASKVAHAILNRHGMLLANWFENPFVLHVSRMALMLADHYYSSEPSQQRYGEADYSLHANTDRCSGTLKQRLDEHLIGVAVNAKRIVRILPRLVQQLPRIVRHKGFRQRSKDARFRWQDRAFDLAQSVRDRAVHQGFFGVNMASTGCGKTLANGRILYALADPYQGARFSIALGLRTLTLQTGEVYRQRLYLGDEDLAVLVGGGAIRALHEQQVIDTHFGGSESTAGLLPEHTHVHFEGSLEDGPLNRWLTNHPNAQKLLNAPILACTIDHLMPATESLRGGHQIAPMLRLMTSDLVLDEPDDFGIEDLPALSRLVHWAGLLGSRVLLSSATLPPSLIQGLFIAYLDGRRCYQQNRGMPGQPVNPCCAWFDEYGAAAGDHVNGDSYRRAHQTFVEKRLKKLNKAQRRRCAEILPLPITQGQPREIICAELAEHLHHKLHLLHEKHHSVDLKTAKRVSFGLIRMANINPLVDTAMALYRLGAKEHTRIYLCVYHSQHPLLVRSGIERRLDRLLNRKDPEAIFQEPSIRCQLDTVSDSDHIYVVLATAVAEVGRDHDYDWGIVEPSSMRSIIQLAGRIRRHRSGACAAANLCLLDTNIRNLVHAKGSIAFTRPGYESKQFPLDVHQLSELLLPEQLDAIDASHRISESSDPQPRHNLVDLEHARLQALMVGEGKHGPVKIAPVNWWWVTRACLSGELQRKQQFRADPLGRQRYGLLPDQDGNIRFYKIEADGQHTLVGNLKHDLVPEPGPRIEFWGETDYLSALEELADNLGMEIDACAKRFGVLDLPARGAEQGWSYHSALGFSRFY